MLDALLRLLFYPVGIYVSVMGLWRIGTAPSPGGMVAGMLMLLAGLTVFPHGRVAVQVLMGRRLSTGDALVVFLGCMFGAAALNVMFP